MARRAHVVVVALAVCAGSVLPLRGDGQSARAEVGSATGPLLSTDGAGAVLVARDLRPGESRAGDITVTNAGDAAGAFSLSESGRVDSPTPAGPLSAVLDLVVSDLTAGRTVYAGKVADLAQVALGNFAQGEAHHFRFVVAFPGGRPSSLDNPFQLATTTVSYLWSAGPPALAPPASATPPATLGGTDVHRRPIARLVASARQRARNGRVRVTVICEASCRVTVTAVAKKGARARLRPVMRTLRKAGRVTLRLTLPPRVRAARTRGRRVSVSVRLRATIAGRTVTARKTVRLSPTGR
jgi:spore coat-associated protein N